MIIPIVCRTAGCAGAGREVNRVSGIPPPDLDLFFEGYDGSDPADQCPMCRQVGIAEDPLLEYGWEARYYD